MERRRFLAGLLAAPLAIYEAGEVDWERLLWTPKTIITVPGLPIEGLTFLDELTATTLREIYPGVVDNYFTANPILAYIRELGPAMFHGRPITWHY